MFSTHLKSQDSGSGKYFVSHVPQEQHVPLIPTFLSRMVSQHQEEFVDENLLVSHGAKQLFTEGP